jgi:adenylate cyclase
LAEMGVEQKLAAILAADVAGYTRLMAEDEPATISTITEYRTIFRQHIEANGGRVVDMAGDSILAMFTSAAGAVKAAVDAQAELAPKNQALPEARRMQFRVGVNLGDIREADDGTVYGDGVNIAARLEGLADPGGVMISEDAHRQVRRDPDLAFADAGLYGVKNVAEPVHAWRAVTGNEAASSQASPALPDKPSIAVLAFDNLSHDPDQDYLADGISEDLITEMSRIHWLFVTARNSAFTYKGEAVDVKQVGRELGVRYVLEGSVRQAGKRIRVSAQLIDATTGNHLWAERYDRELEDIFALQDEITSTIAAAIEPELGAAERERAVRRAPESLEAWGLYQRGLDYLYRFTGPDNVVAKRLLRGAADADPRFAAPLGALAYALYFDCALQFSASPELTVREALEVGRAAISRDASDPWAQFGMGRAHEIAEQYPEAIARLEKTIELSPNFALAYLGLAVAMNLSGRHTEAIANAETAIRLSPRDPVRWGSETQLAAAYFQLCQYERTAEVARNAVRHANAGFWPHLHLIAALALLDRIDEAGAAVVDFRTRWPDFRIASLPRAVGVQDASDAAWRDGLRKAGFDEVS